MDGCEETPAEPGKGFWREMRRPELEHAVQETEGDGQLSVKVLVREAIMLGSVSGQFGGCWCHY